MTAPHTPRANALAAARLEQERMAKIPLRFRIPTSIVLTVDEGQRLLDLIDRAPGPNRAMLDLFAEHDACSVGRRRIG